MGAPYQFLNDPPADYVPIPVETSSVDLLIGGFPGQKFADLVIGAANSIHSASYSFVAGDIGKILAIISGTNFTLDTFVITAVTDGVATLSASPGTEGAVGGCGYFVTDCRGLLILGTGNVAVAPLLRPTQKETLTSFPVGLLRGRFAKVFKAANGTTATNIYGMF